MPLALKFTNIDGTPCSWGKGKWSLPNGVPGDWMPAIKGELTPRRRGYHLCRLPPAYDALVWCGPALWIAEYDDQMIEDSDKIVVRRARLIRRVETWTDVTARLLACDFAERVLPLFECARPDDDRPRRAIETARRFVCGKATAEELDAARDAAWDARAAAGAAAGAAAWAAWDAAGAAGDAAWAAAWAAAWDAAWAAAGEAERAWQIARFADALGLPAIIAEVERELAR